MPALRKKSFDLDLVSPSQYRGAGVVEDVAYERQPPGTTPYAVNMRPFDPRSGKRRLSRRGGMAGLGASAFPGAGINLGARIQAIEGVFRPAAVTTSNVKGRTLKVAVVAGGTIRSLTVTGPPAASYSSASGATLSASAFVQAAPLLAFIYFVDGTSTVRWSADSNTAVNLVATAGTVPAGCRLAASWRGRLVLASSVAEPQNWFMSAVDEPRNWDYVPTPATATQAVAGNNAPAGLAPDVITALVPLDDDRLLFGGDKSLYVMRGDPADGGRIDLVTDAAGMAWGRAWCKLPDGSVAFYGSRGGVFVYSGDGVKRISEGRVESRLRSVAGATTQPVLAWNDDDQGLHVFLADLTGLGANNHLFWCSRTDSWWIDDFVENGTDPTAAYVYDADGTADRVLLVGGLNGVVRYFEPTSDWDENTGIPWEVFFGPLSLGDGRHAMVDEIEAVFADYATSADWELRTGETAEKAFAAAFKRQGDWLYTQGPRHTVREGLSGNTVYLRVSNKDRPEDSGSFASFEKLKVVLRESGSYAHRLRRG